MARPEAARVQEAGFVHHCNLSALQKYLPLRWPKPTLTPPSPKKSYRSSYRYPGWQKLADVSTSLVDIDDFELLLYLVDFSGCRALGLEIGPG